MDLERRLVALREQHDACRRMVAGFPRSTPRVVVAAAKTVCNDLNAEIRALLLRLAERRRSHSAQSRLRRESP